jgi:hypothetical protein
MSLMDIVVSPPGCDRSVTDFWGWVTHEAQLRCGDEVDGDIWIWSGRWYMDMKWMVIYGYEVEGDIWIWSGWWYVDMKWMVIYGYEVPGGALNLSSTKLPRPWSPWDLSPSRKNPHGRTGNRTRDLMISSQKLWPLNHEDGHSNVSDFILNVLKNKTFLKKSILIKTTTPYSKYHNSSTQVV